MTIYVSLTNAPEDRTYQSYSQCFLHRNFGTFSISWSYRLLLCFNDVFLETPLSANRDCSIYHTYMLITNKARQLLTTCTQARGFSPMSRKSYCFAYGFDSLLASECLFSNRASRRDKFQFIFFESAVRRRKKLVKLWRVIVENSLKIKAESLY